MFPALKIGDNNCLYKYPVLKLKPIVELVDKMVNSFHMPFVSSTKRKNVISYFR